IIDEVSKWRSFWSAPVFSGAFRDLSCSRIHSGRRNSRTPRRWREVRTPLEVAERHDVGAKTRNEHLQIPNPKRAQTAKSHQPASWDLHFGICLEGGCWNLEFGSVSWLCAEDFTLEGFRSAAGLQVVH